jgi:DnaJ-class molecular chaperone
MTNEAAAVRAAIDQRFEHSQIVNMLDELLGGRKVCTRCKGDGELRVMVDQDEYETEKPCGSCKGSGVMRPSER